MQQIENYEILPIGRTKDLTNQIFNNYKVLYRTRGTTKDHVYWLCQCIKCKKYIVKNTHTLKNGKNECSCNNDLTGKVFGRWTVIYLTNKKTKNRGLIYHCKCICGNEKDVPAETLRKGESQSCGCYNKEKIKETAIKNRLDLTGQRFGKLVALSPIYPEEKNKHTKWICHCDCGNVIEVDMGNLRQGFSKSCGCTQSQQEENIIKILTKNNISYKYQYVFKDLSQYKFDFYINDKYIIEFDGQQHFKLTGYGWDTKEAFQKRHQNDLEKNRYCFEHDIPIIRIPYNKKYDLNDLKLETTHYLLTQDNENEYYASIKEEKNE